MGRKYRGIFSCSTLSLLPCSTRRCLRKLSVSSVEAAALRNCPSSDDKKFASYICLFSYYRRKSKSTLANAHCCLYVLNIGNILTDCTAFASANRTICVPGNPYQRLDLMPASTCFSLLPKASVCFADENDFVNGPSNSMRPKATFFRSRL